jgi:hypothetical protein
MPVTLENLDEVFTYHPPDDQQQTSYAAINDAAKEFARVILRFAPNCADRQAAIREVRNARMIANAAVALKGKV